MSWQTWRALVAVGCTGLLAGCGEGGNAGLSGPRAGDSGKRVHLIGFDASEPIIAGLRQGSIDGVILQNPLKMGELGVKTLVQYLEKQPVERRISTGEALATPENMNTPDIKSLVFAPRADKVNSSLSGTKSRKWRVMIIPKETTQEFWLTIHAGALNAEQELGNVEVVWQGPQKEDDRVQQIQLVQSAVAAGVDGIVLAPLDARALALPVETAVAKGIPVVVIDSGLESTKPVSYISTDNYHGGVLAAEQMGKLLGGEGKVILLRYAVGSESTEKREKGFTDKLASGFPRITLLSESEYAGPTSDLALQTSQSLVTRYRGQFDGVFCPNETSTVAMMRALQEAGLLPGRH
jgi:ribose transport system substrate-binding protein